MIGESEARSFATPERADGIDVLALFEGRIAAELAYGEGLQAHAQAAEFRLKGKQR